MNSTKTERSVYDIVKYAVVMPNGQTIHSMFGRPVSKSDIDEIRKKIKEKTPLSTFIIESAGGVLTIKRQQSFRKDWNYPEEEEIIWQSYKMLPTEISSFLVAAPDPKVLEYITEQLKEVRDRDYHVSERLEDNDNYIDIQCMFKPSFY
jgi:hypothetical protein